MMSALPMMRFLPYVPAGAHHERSAIIGAADIICRRQKSFIKPRGNSMMHRLMPI